VVLDNFAPIKISRFIEALFMNAQFCEVIVFNGYQKCPRDLQIKHVIGTKFDSLVFSRCTVLFCNSMMGALRDFQGRLRELGIMKMGVDTALVGRMWMEFARLPCGAEIQHLQLTETLAPPFVKDLFVLGMNALVALETITILNTGEIDGSQLLAAICRTTSPIRRIVIQESRFRGVVRVNRVVPPTLALLSVVGSDFSTAALLSVFALVGRGTRTQPLLMFDASKIRIQDPDVAAFASFDFQAIESRVAELDFCGNKITKEMAVFLFKFLARQRDLLMLSLQKITLDAGCDDDKFLSALRKAIISLKVKGLDLSGRFPPQQFAEFVQSLQAARHLRRICLTCEFGGDVVVNALAELVTHLPGLLEIAADGQTPTSTQAFYALWEAIVGHPGNPNCDGPREDINAVKINPHHLSAEHRALFLALAGRQRPATSAQRYECYVAELKRPPTEDDTGESRLGDVMFSMGSGFPEKRADRESFMSDVARQTGQAAEEAAPRISRQSILAPRRKSRISCELDEEDADQSGDSDVVPTEIETEEAEPGGEEEDVGEHDDETSEEPGDGEVRGTESPSPE
jgi:hypothetical protein